MEYGKAEWNSDGQEQKRIRMWNAMKILDYGEEASVDVFDVVQRGWGRRGASTKKLG